MRFVRHATGSRWIPFRVWRALAGVRAVRARHADQHRGSLVRAAPAAHLLFCRIASHNTRHTLLLFNGYLAFTD
eukprot:3960007-Pleurochrysis_carterae.AAC.1